MKSAGISCGNSTCLSVASSPDYSQSGLGMRLAYKDGPSRIMDVIKVKV